MMIGIPEEAALLAAYQILYSHSFIKKTSDGSLEEVLASYPDSPDNPVMEIHGEAIKNLVFGIFRQEAELDKLIKPNLKGWSYERLGKSELILLRLGTYLLKNGISLNRAKSMIDGLASQFNIDSAINFINGVLEAASRSLHSSESKRN